MRSAWGSFDAVSNRTSRLTLRNSAITSSGSGRFDVDVFPDDEQVILFEEMLAPVLPKKGVI